MDEAGEQGLAEVGDSSAAGAGDFGQQAADVEAFELAADRVSLATARGGIARFAAEDVADVGVVEAVQNVFAAEHGGEEFCVFALGGIEAGVATWRDSVRFVTARVVGVGSLTTDSASR